MAVTDFLAITHVEAQQAQKEVTLNEALEVIDRALAGELVHDMTSDADYSLVVTPPEKEQDYLFLHISDSGTLLSATRDIILPARAQLHAVWNDTAQSLRFKTAAGAAVTVAAGTAQILYIEGGGYDALALAAVAVPGEPPAEPYDVGLYFPGLPSDGQELLRLKATRAFSLPDGAAGSNAEARVAATGTAIFSLQKNGSEVATITFSAGTAGSFAQSGVKSFAEDDVLTLVGPATADATLADIGVLLKGER